MRLFISSSNISSSTWLRWWVFLSFMPFALFFLGSEILIRSYIEKYDAKTTHVKNFWIAKESGVKNTVFGDSKAAFGFSGIRDVVNLAYPSESVPMMLEKALLYFDDGPVGNVIIQADPAQFALHRDTAEVDKKIERYSSDSWIRTFSTQHRALVFRYWKSFLFGEQFLSNIKFKADGSQPRVGYITDRKNKLTSVDQMTAYARKKGPRTDVPLKTTRTAEAYRHLVQQLQSKSGSICLVSFPASPIYAEVSKSMRQYQEAFIFFDQLSTDFQVKYVNNWTWSSDESLYFNHGHLNIEGALKFSPEVYESCFRTD